MKYADDIPREIPVNSFADYVSQLTSMPGIGNKHPQEIIARTNRALLRKAVINALKTRLFSEKLPYIHLAYYPKGYRTVATFRIDCDESNQVDFDRVVNLAGLHNIPLTLFVHVKSQQSYLPHIASIRQKGQDVQLHCYKHETYNDYRNNLDNLIKGKKMMEEAGMKVSGFAAPYGKWNPFLNRVMEKLDFAFSSEFALCYDDLPFFPLINRHVSKVLQLPVHPVCVGLLRKAGLSPEEMKQYFDRTISEKYERNEPIMFYGHPYKEIDQYPELFNYMLSRISQLSDIWITTYSEFATWWKKRLHARFTVRIKKKLTYITTGNSDPTLHIHIEKPDRSELLLPLANQSFYTAEIMMDKTTPV